MLNRPKVCKVSVCATGTPLPTHGSGTEQVWRLDSRLYHHHVVSTKTFRIVRCIIHDSKMSLWSCIPKSEFRSRSWQNPTKSLPRLADNIALSCTTIWTGPADELWKEYTSCMPKKEDTSLIERFLKGIWPEIKLLGPCTEKHLQCPDLDQGCNLSTMKTRSPNCLPRRRS